MLTLIKKDIMTSLRIRSIKAIVIIVFLNIMTFLSPLYFGGLIPIFMPMFLASIIAYIIVMNTFYYDSKDKSERYMASLPIKREDVVYGKYIFTIIILIGSIVVTNLLSSWMIYENAREMVFQDVILSIIIVLVSMSIIIPSIYKFGYSKVRIIVPILTILIGYISSKQIDFSRYLNDGSSNWFLEFSKKISVNIYRLFDLKIHEFQKLTISVAFAIISLIAISMFITSMYLSIKIYKKRNIG